MTAALVGLALGWFGSMPIGGPVSLFVLRRGAAGRYRDGLALAAGAALAEAGYCAAALFGYGVLLDRWPWLRPIVGLLGGVILLGIGLYFLLSRSAAVPENRSRPDDDGGGLRDFVLGFTLLAVNPSVLVSWLAALAAVQAAGLVLAGPADRIAFVAAVAIGIVAWFGLFLRLLQLGRHRVTPGLLTRVLRGLGALLCVLGVGTLVGLLRP